MLMYSSINKAYCTYGKFKLISISLLNMASVPPSASHVDNAEVNVVGCEW